MGQLTFVKLIVLCTLFIMVQSTKDKSDKPKNPDVLKEFRTFADTVIPAAEEPYTRNLKNISAAVKDPSHQFTLLVDGPSVSQSSPQNIAVSSRDTVMKDNTPISTNLITKPVNETSSFQRNLTANNAPGGIKREVENAVTLDDVYSGVGDDDDDDDDEPITNTKESSKLTKDSKDGGNVIDEITTPTKDAPEPITGVQVTGQLLASNPPEAVTNNVQVKKKSKKLKKPNSKDTATIAKPLESSTGNVTTVNEKSKKPSETLINYEDDDIDTYVEDVAEKPKKNVKTNAVKKKQPKQVVKAKQKKKAKPVSIQPDVFIYEEPHQPKPIQHHIGDSRSGASEPPPPPPPSTCMDGCADECAPACTQQCCELETAPPPFKEPEAPVKEKTIRWMERAHYEPGPNYPPPPIPALVIKKVMSPPSKCAPSCSRTCTPGCLPMCCRPNSFPQVIGCSKNCTPHTCVLGCPLHCCARYVKKSKVTSEKQKGVNE